jgi:CarD family transcriptional regulator
MEVFVLFSIGDKVVYPMQGTGVIERIEDKLFSGKNKEYIIIKIISNNLEIMIPSDKISNSNLRKISDSSTLNNVLFNLTNRNNDSENASAKERYQSNMNKIKSGALKDSAEVLYDLMLINKEKSLNASEKQLFNTAHKFVVEEISLIKDISVVEATDFLNLSIN